MNDVVVCRVCGVQRKQITIGHVKTHGFKNTKEYLDQYPGATLYSKSTIKAKSESHALKLDKYEQDEQIAHTFHIPKNRTKRRISYAEFVSLSKQGFSLIEMKRSGISKHQIGFYSSLAQGKINVTRDEFEKMYLSGQSLDAIGRKYDMQRDDVTQLREYFGIHRLGAKFIQRKQTEKSLNDIQNSLLYGTLMGDGGKMSMSSAKIKQSIKQRFYSLWKYELMNEHVSTYSLRVTAEFDKRYNKWRYAVRFYTHANTDIENILKEFYKTGTKCITENILSNINELALAVWFMDDGMTDWYERNGGTQKPTCKFCTDDFSLSEVEMICNWLNQLKIECRITCGGKKKNGVNKYRPSLTNNGTEKLFKIIEPFIIPTMRYKIDRTSYRAYAANREIRNHLLEKQECTVIREELNEVAEYILNNHPDKLDELNIFANKRVKSLIKKSDIAYRFLKESNRKTVV